MSWSAYTFNILKLSLASGCILLAWAVYRLLIFPRSNPLRTLAGPPVSGLFGNHMPMVLDPFHSPKTHETFIREYGRSVCIRGVGPWDDRLFTLDPVSMAHVMKNSITYEKPWQSRRLITGLIGCGLLAAEGQMHKRQRRVATPAFSISNLRKLVPLVWRKGGELRDRWSLMLDQIEKEKPDQSGMVVDVSEWISRATFDVIGLAGFDYDFDATNNEGGNELFRAYKEMFEVAISQNPGLRQIVGIYLPWIDQLFPDKIALTVKRCQDVIKRVAGTLIKEKKAKIAEGEASGKPYDGKDLLSLLLKSNASADLSPDQRISDEDILHNINTFMFAGSDTTSLALTWTFLLLAHNPHHQARLREELLSIAHVNSSLEDEELESWHDTLANLSFLDNVCKESLRLIPPVHSSLRVATKDDVIPTSHAVRMRSTTGLVEKRAGEGVFMPKGSFVHVPIEAFNLDKEFWGEDAWEFRPDRWDNLPEAAKDLPGLYSNLLTFSAGPRSCIGMRFSMIEMKCFIYLLLTNFTFTPTEAKIFKANVVLTRPYVRGKFAQGSQCPLLIQRYVRN